MISDRELDARLAGASGVDDADLPALPDKFLIRLMSDDQATSTRTGVRAVAAGEEPASVVAARQLVRDARAARTVRPRRRRPTRTTVLRLGAALVAVAAAWTTATLVAPSGHDGSSTAHPTAPASGAGANGIRLVAARQDAFPVSFDPPPAGITPTFTKHAGDGGADPTVYTADYETATSGGFTLWLYGTDPRASAVLQHDYFDWPENDPNRARVTDTGTVTVHGAPAVYSHGRQRGACASACQPFAALLWQLPDRQWAYVLGEGAYGELSAAQEVANSLVDRPQPTGLQLALAPAGWTLHGYEESRSLDLISDTDPKQRLHLSTIDRSGGATLDGVFQHLTTVGAPEAVTIDDQPGRLATGRDTGGGPDFWYVDGQFPHGPLFLLLAPKTLTRQQVLDIAAAATYTP